MSGGVSFLVCWLLAASRLLVVVVYQLCALGVAVNICNGITEKDVTQSDAPHIPFILFCQPVRMNRQGTCFDDRLKQRSLHVVAFVVHTSQNKVL